MLGESDEAHRILKSYQLHYCHTDRRLSSSIFFNRLHDDPGHAAVHNGTLTSAVYPDFVARTSPVNQTNIVRRFTTASSQSSPVAAQFSLYRSAKSTPTIRPTACSLRGRRNIANKRRAGLLLYAPVCLSGASATAVQQSTNVEWENVDF